MSVRNGTNSAALSRSQWTACSEAGQSQNTSFAFVNDCGWRGDNRQRSGVDRHNHFVEREDGRKGHRQTRGWPRPFWMRVPLCRVRRSACRRSRM